jgi:2-polyprenyl-6-methoxyphenol hydroxylase-like FAD-dependent oxidoreductase
MQLASTSTPRSAKQLGYVLVGEWVAEIPAHAQNDHLARVLAPFERIVWADRHGPLPYQDAGFRSSQWNPLIQVADDSTVLRNDIYDRDPVPVWGLRRVTLLGDAAHPMTPNLGQGACQAIEDGLELASVLAAETNVKAGLKNYEARRIVRTRSIVLASRRLGAVGQIESSLLCHLRDLALRLTPESFTMRSLAPILGYEGHLAD